MLAIPGQTKESKYSTRRPNPSLSQLGRRERGCATRTTGHRCSSQRQSARLHIHLAGWAVSYGWRPGVAHTQQGYYPSTHRIVVLSTILGHILQDQRDYGAVVTTHIGRQAGVQLTLDLIILTQSFHLAINFDSLFHTRGTHRMPETHQTSTWIDWDIPLNRGAAREHQVNPLSLFGPANRLIHHELGDREAVVHFRHLYILRGQASVP